ncbi:MAG: hypothetical protein WC278_04250 [Bacilli bacterium]|jgi:hypothetical protein|nr:hypothetical protein [Bacilli bacterium]MDD2682439.1 hypothetical protein [Bacilli bacterium]MDD3121627.1 hypothetical protein [Bacilli bacterium]MDD4063858.1 hypothetical protein [Bacilli bacterium]MDD4482344.1 hypothetical protein [Bacilli bacterium]
MDNNLKPVLKPNLWKKGKKQQKMYLEINLRKSTSMKTFIFGLVITIIIALPIALALFQFLDVYKWNTTAFRIFLLLAWILILLVNGLSNFFTVLLAKSYNPEMDNLMDIDEYAILFYQTFNPGFAIFVLILFIVFGVSF